MTSVEQDAVITEESLMITELLHNNIDSVWDKAKVWSSDSLIIKPNLKPGMVI